MIVPRVRLGVSLAGLTVAPTLRAQVQWASGLGFASVALNAAAADARPRDLGRSARRDLAAVLRRAELALAGLDLWIPPAHLIDPATSDRAASSAMDAIDLAAELAALCDSDPSPARLSITLPDHAASPGVIDSLAARALERGVTLADHQWPPADPGTAVGVRVGIDPATLLIAGADPGRELLRLGERAAAARLSDLDGSGRVEPGTGRLALQEYLIAATLHPGLGPLVLDLRGVAQQERAARAVMDRSGSGPHD